MSRIIAENMAHLVSRCESSEAAREAAEIALRLAAEQGYDQDSTAVVSEVCDQLRLLAAAEPDIACKRRIIEAIEVVCDSADAHRSR